MTKGTTSLNPNRKAKRNVTTSLNPTRKIKNIKISKLGLGFIHDLDNYTVYESKKKALSERARFMNLEKGKFAVVKSRNPRVPTFYTFIQDKRKNLPDPPAKVKFNRFRQGPHVIPHHGLHQGLVMARKHSLYDAFDKLIVKPEDYNKLVDGEIPTNHPKAKLAGFAKHYYQRRYNLHSSLKEVVKGTNNEPDKVKFFNNINRMLQVHPYATFGYKGNGASKRKLSGKGERWDKPIDLQVDMPSSNSYNNKAAADNHTRTTIDILGGLGVPVSKKFKSTQKL